MKKIIVLYICIIMLMLVACNKEAAEQFNTQGDIEITKGSTIGDADTATTDVTKSTTKMLPLEKRGKGQAESCIGADDAGRLGVSKVLVWIGANTSLDGVDPAIVSRFNELLVNKYGCDFVVDFQSYNIVSQKVEQTYEEAVADMRSLGQQADILYAGTNFKYSEMVAGGYYTPLSKFFDSSEEGKEFYASYPEEIWSALGIDGEIYGYTSYSIPGFWGALVCNRSMAGQLDLDLAEQLSFYELGRILEKADFISAGIDTDKTVEICANVDTLLMMLKYHNTGKGIFIKKNTEEKWKAFNIAEDKEFIKLCETIREYKKGGWYVCNDYAVSEAKNLMAEGGFLFDLALLHEGNLLDGKYLKKGSNKNGVHEVIVGATWYDYYEKREHAIHGIASWSENKEDAFKLLALINTKPELSNLLQHGIEGVHYVYENNEVRRLYSDYDTTDDIANCNITFPEELEPENQLEFYKSISKEYEVSPEFVYDIDWSGVSEECTQLTKIFNEYKKGLFCGTYEDVGATLKEMSEELKAAGIDRVVAAVNSQMK